MFGFPPFLNQFNMVWASCCLAIISGDSIYIWNAYLDNEGNDGRNDPGAGAMPVPADCKDMCRADMG
jgi:hypothetical protein